MASSEDQNTSPRIVQWFIDTRPLWPIPKKANSRDEVKALEQVATKELALLTPVEQASVLRYYYLRDAKTKLASHLLKHLAITQFCSVPWSESTISLGPKGKPFYLAPSSSARLDFNVSHQAGLVSLIAAVDYPVPVDVGTDIVCVNERRKVDLENIDEKGFFEWVDMHGEVFADSELSEMKLAPTVDVQIKGSHGAGLSGYGMDTISRCQRRSHVVKLTIMVEGREVECSIKGDDVIDAKLRRFYAWWCARETYVKMTGEAFAAPWLKELEMRGVQAPDVREGSGELFQAGVSHIRGITFKGRDVEDVKMEIAALGEQYMIGAAVRVPNGFQKDGKELKLGHWKQLDLERDVLSFAE